MATSRGSSSVTPKTPARTQVALVASDEVTRRQAEILRWWVDPLGFSKSQIAHKMQLGLRTVESHIKAIYKKLKLHNRMQAQRYARHNKLD
ncbi:MAG: helix-turn-helix transcriptional regulator [Flavobacteriales bacterium]|nr:helix-turn-helix transcriptional regulator [Flavobacteriales bacterium]